MALPPLAETPPATIRLNIAPEEWEACLESWLTLAGLHLGRLTKGSSGKSISDPSLPRFLTSFYRESAQANHEDRTLQTPMAVKLRRTTFALTNRLLSSSEVDSDLLQAAFVADFCRLHAKARPLPPLLKDLWRRKDGQFCRNVETWKGKLLKSLNQTSTNMEFQDLRRLVGMVRVSPDIAIIFMTGSDFLDVLASDYTTSNSDEYKSILVAIVYFGLVSLVNADPPHLSLLSDQLYSLKAQAEKAKPPILADLVTNTPLISKLRRSLDATSNSRLTNLLDTVATFNTPSIARHAKHPRRNKGKVKATQSNGEMHMHRMSLVTQVQDLFPDLGSGFVLKLLDEYDDDVEQVTAHLLDDSLPPHLHHIDRTEQTDAFDNSQKMEIEDLAPRSTPPLQPYIPERRNVFDDDELDRLDFDTGKLHVGKKEASTSTTEPNKAAILSALAAFDSDDDERDDTYDVEDVGGTVDSAHPDGEPGPSARVTQEENDMALFTVYKSSPQLFDRAFDVRKGQARQALKAETGMTDEQIEGWATMLKRDPRRLKRLEGQYGAFDGKQTDLARTSYRESPAGTETEDSDAPAADRGGYRGRGRGRGRAGGIGRGGNVAVPSGDAGTAAAQRRKEANKGSRANHNRRDQRARKMARGGFAG